MKHKSVRARLRDFSWSFYRLNLMISMINFSIIWTFSICKNFLSIMGWEIRKVIYIIIVSKIIRFNIFNGFFSEQTVYMSLAIALLNRSWMDHLQEKTRQAIKRVFEKLISKCALYLLRRTHWQTLTDRNDTK